jgi:catenin beta 1
METVVSYAITTLHNVLLACGDIKVQLRKLGGIQKMVPLLTRHKNAKFLAIVVDCLQLLSHGHQESKVLLLEFGGPGLLIEILRSSNYPKLILMTMRLLKVLSVCSQNKKALINCGKRVNKRESISS